ncbi:MAG: hypothetical protein AAFV53_19935 [Myxococcota bacterium]
MSIEKTALAVWDTHKREYLQEAVVYLNMGKNYAEVTKLLLEQLQEDLPVFDAIIDEKLTHDRWPDPVREALERWDDKIATGLSTLIQIAIKRMVRRAAGRHQTSLSEARRLWDSTMPTVPEPPSQPAHAYSTSTAGRLSAN